MLALHPIPSRPRITRNLLPTKTGMATRPGATQIVAGDIANAAPWGNRLVLEKQGRIALWAGTAEQDIAPAGRGLVVTNYQAVIGEGQREERAYVADGVNPLWFIARRAGAFGRYTIANKVKDAAGLAYPVPVANTVATWRGRLWAGLGNNRVQHCQFNDPEYWDPLWTPEFQGAEPGHVLALEPMKDLLAVGLSNSNWQLTGDSHYNWLADTIDDSGCTGPNALASDEAALYWISKVGIHRRGQAEPISDDIREAFAGAPYPGELAVDKRRRLLLALVGGRLFVMHLDKPGAFGEIHGQAPRGLLQMTDYTGWYGADGAWVLGARDVPDRALDGTASAFTSLFETWDDVPNPGAGGRALLTRTILVAAGSARGNATYRASVDDTGTFETDIALSSVAVQRWTDQIAGLEGEAWPTPPVRHELPAYLAGTRFRHSLSAPCHLELFTFTPKYKFGGEA